MNSNKTLNLEQMKIEEENSDKPHNPQLNISAVSGSYIKWLQKRIEKTEKELDEATELNLKIGKGAKLCVYKECLNYIRTH
jgi:50S ribosomal subunit-associated GTPase HflX